MATGTSFLRFSRILSAHRHAIDYRPLRGEAQPQFPFQSPSVSATIPANRAANPFKTADYFATLLGNAGVCVYLPGRAFDALGTRHGRGGGWYDRFLVSIPSEWMRIGFCLERDFSSQILKREEWDQLVDWVCVQKTDRMEYYETNAR